MTILLDTDSIDSDLRAEAVVEVVRQAAGPQHVIPAPDRQSVRARMEVWELGETALYRMRSPWLRLVRTEKHVRTAPGPMLALAIAEAPITRCRFGAAASVYSHGQMFLVDMNVPYDIGWSEPGAQTALFVPLDRLALPMETIRAAAPWVTASPLYPLVTRHIATLAQSADVLEADPAVHEIGGASTELARALLVSAAGQGTCDGRAVPTEILLTQIREYVRSNLADPRLSPETIARAHNVSVRYLYKLCATANLRLEQWIITERLARARADLARPELNHRAIAAIARGWGFRDPSHFARRFRATFGMTPREWRACCLARAAE
ncbi:helix-turn-helix domain-containing protein [Nocardia sp. NPDC050406]|uniref:helix-turn-helix domain-containing protein n=1 Tax=Nocardia sp. NPDC050406 TaxID=3364318 RepID=UPI0037BACBD1